MTMWRSSSVMSNAGHFDTVICTFSPVKIVDRFPLQLALAEQAMEPWHPRKNLGGGGKCDLEVSPLSATQLDHDALCNASEVQSICSTGVDDSTDADSDALSKAETVDYHDHALKLCYLFDAKARQLSCLSVLWRCAL
eukprot:6463846-Amphidinium_carterae.1